MHGTGWVVLTGPLPFASCAHCQRRGLLECSEPPTWKLPVLVPPCSALQRERVLICFLSLQGDAKGPTWNSGGPRQSLLTLGSLEVLEDGFLPLLV